MSATAAGVPHPTQPQSPVKPQSPAQFALRQFLARPVALAGLGVIVLFILVAAFAPLVAPYDPIATSWSAIRKAPSAAHWMGTDENGRDVLARVIFGARASMLAGVESVLIAAAIIAEASLSFLGLGQQPPDPSWGSMLNAAPRFLSQAPWLAVFPGLAIFLCVLSFNLVGDGLRDAWDPHTR